MTDEMRPVLASNAASGAIRPGANVILCADDFAISEGVSRGIIELAHARRLSATGAMVNLPAWHKDARQIAPLRAFLAVGVHLNLTLGSPLGRCPGLAPTGEFSNQASLMQRCLTSKASTDEIAGEIDRQLARFEDATGFLPDMIDGHQHVHTLPRVRQALIQVLRARYRGHRPLIRNPSDRPTAIMMRRTAASKALIIHSLARGFGAAVRAAGFPTNFGFAGVSPFNLNIPFEQELSRFFKARGRRHLVMCHPGHPDLALAELDPVVERRRQELDALFAAPRLDEAIWHVEPRADRAPVDWEKVLPL